jgi:hypothetical protein
MGGTCPHPALMLLTLGTSKARTQSRVNGFQALDSFPLLSTATGTGTLARGQWKVEPTPVVMAP